MIISETIDQVLTEDEKLRIGTEIKLQDIFKRFEIEENNYREHHVFRKGVVFCELDFNSVI